ncbi:MAG: VWA domain-containing protein [Bacteroidetes bacterium]|nr:VWA domain-containing protein [Bacteroidota bacterium]
MFNDITFAYYPFLLFLLVIPLIIAWYVWKRNDRRAHMRYSHSGFIDGVRKSLRIRLVHLPFALRMLAMILLIVAMARPQSSSKMQEITVEGIDIVVCIDISGSMLAEDFKPNRMEAAKKNALEFIDMRKGDRIGMTVFAGQSFTLCPLTTDHNLLKDLTRSIHTGMVEDGTAIGNGLATSINRLRESEAISKVIVLLTDGINNAGMIDHLTAAEIAALQKIRVYTIGVGSDGPVPYPFQSPFGKQYRNVEIPVDEVLLKEMAAKTGGKYFWANTPNKLQDVYKEIDQMERSKIDVTEFSRKHDEYFPLVILALFILLIEIVLRNTWLRSLP